MSVLIEPSLDKFRGIRPDKGVQLFHQGPFQRGAGGTGANASLDRDDILVAGKTGTSQVNRASTDRNQAELAWEHRDHALFVCYAPAAAPR